MTAEDQETYGKARSMCEFMANVATIMEYSGGLNESLRCRVEESVRPVREARDRVWRIGQVIGSEALPIGLHEALEITERRVREAFPGFRALMDEACDQLLRADGKAEARRRFKG